MNKVGTNSPNLSRVLQFREENKHELKTIQYIHTSKEGEPKEHGVGRRVCSVQLGGTREAL